jgi:hypothetical protein
LWRGCFNVLTNNAVAIFRASIFAGTWKPAYRSGSGKNRALSNIAEEKKLVSLGGGLEVST